MAHRPKVLVVENDPATLRQIEATLRVMGAEPHCLTSSQKAAALINKEKFDGAFLEWDIPELNGEELTKRIRRSRSNSKIPIAMITDNTDTQSIAEGFKLGVTFFLSKPVGGKELGRLLNASRGAMLENRRGYQRVPLKAPVLCGWEGNRIAGQGVNVSASGLLVSLTQKPEVGSDVSVEFALPRTQPPFDLRAVVARHGGERQVGVKFSNISQEQRGLLKSFVDRFLSGLPSLL